MLLDSTLPELDGFRLVEQIRKQPAASSTRIMLLVRAGRRGDAALCRRLGIAAYLTRPLKSADLFDAILTVLGMSPGQEPLFLITRHSLRESARPLRVLVLTTRVHDRAKLAEVLEEDGHTVLSAGNSAQAASTLRQQPVDLVFAALRWSGLGAEGVITLLEAAQGAERPACVAIAPHWTGPAKRRAISAGMQACLTRPLRPAQLRRVVEQIRKRVQGGA
jgi:CheY-like chemotaxis protein